MLGRQRTDCESYAFVTPEDRRKLPNIVAHLQCRGQFVLQELQTLAAREPTKGIVFDSSAGKPSPGGKGTKRSRYDGRS
jgi:hypothetical protein